MYNKTMSLDFWRKDFDNKFPEASDELKGYIESLVEEAYDKGHLQGYDSGLRDALNQNDKP